MTKHIRLSLPDDLYYDLNKLVTHRGHLSYLIRQGIRMVIRVEQDKQRPKETPTKQER